MAQAFRTTCDALTDSRVRAAAGDLPAHLRWAMIWTAGLGRGVGPLRRAPRETCAGCRDRAALAVESTYADATLTGWRTYACHRHVDRVALAGFLATRRPVAAFPLRRGWRLWWRSAPIAVAWRNATGSARLAHDALIPADRTTPPRGSALFAQRRTFW